MKPLSSRYYFLCIQDEMLDGTGGEFAHVLAVPNEVDWRQLRAALPLGHSRQKGAELAEALVAQGAVDLCDYGIGKHNCATILSTHAETVFGE